MNFIVPNQNEIFRLRTASRPSSRHIRNLSFPPYLCSFKSPSACTKLDRRIRCMISNNCLYVTSSILISTVCLSVEIFLSLNKVRQTSLLLISTICLSVAKVKISLSIAASVMISTDCLSVAISLSLCEVRQTSLLMISMDFLGVISPNLFEVWRFPFLPAIFVSNHYLATNNIGRILIICSHLT